MDKLEFNELGFRKPETKFRAAMSTSQISIILADDHQITRTAWRILLENNPRFRVLADCNCDEKAAPLVSELKPDVVLVDINIWPQKGFEVAKQILHAFPSARVIGISVNDQHNYATQMLSLGAKGYLTKTSTLEEINQGIIEVFNGKEYICREIQKNMPK